MHISVIAHNNAAVVPVSNDSFDVDDISFSAVAYQPTVPKRTSVYINFYVSMLQFHDHPAKSAEVAPSNHVQYACRLHGIY